MQYHAQCWTSLCMASQVVYENKLLWLALPLKNLMQAIVPLLGMSQWSLSYKLPRRNLLKSKLSSVVPFCSILNTNEHTRVYKQCFVRYAGINEEGIIANILLESKLNYEDCGCNNIKGFCYIHGSWGEEKMTSNAWK
jgi:hypothetical protein